MPIPQSHNCKLFPIVSKLIVSSKFESSQEHQSYAFIPFVRAYRFAQALRTKNDRTIKRTIALRTIKS